MTKLHRFTYYFKPSCRPKWHFLKVHKRRNHRFFSRKKSTCARIRTHGLLCLSSTLNTWTVWDFTTRKMCVCVCVCKCVCVYGPALLVPLRANMPLCVWVILCVCVCVCVWDRERESVCVCACMKCYSVRLSVSFPILSKASLDKAFKVFGRVRVFDMCWEKKKVLKKRFLSEPSSNHQTSYIFCQLFKVRQLLTIGRK